jgi:hypothetical protein
MDVPSDPQARRQWYLDESLRIAVWELIFGAGDRRIVERLVAAGAAWRPDRVTTPLPSAAPVRAKQPDDRRAKRVKVLHRIGRYRRPVCCSSLERGASSQPR